MQIKKRKSKSIIIHRSYDSMYKFHKGTTTADNYRKGLDASLTKKISSHPIYKY